MSAVLIALPYLLVLRQDRGDFCRCIPEIIVIVKKIGLSTAAGKALTVGDRKRGAIGAVADFLDVVGVGGQIRAKCLCYNSLEMFHVTLFELFRAARRCCDFARSLAVALEKADG